MAAYLKGAALADRVRQLSQGTSVAMTSGTPSRKSTKVRSGRQGRKQYNSRITLQKVGGFSSALQAIAAPADHEMCVVVPHGTGYVNNTANRSPAHHYKVS